MWTSFMDMHSGGGLKEKWSRIYIEADSHPAKLIFYNRFKHNPERISCTCCGEDYSIHSNESLYQLTGYERHCKWENNRYIEELDADPTYADRKFISLEEYCKDPEVLVINHEDIKPSECTGDVPAQGFVWVDLNCAKWDNTVQNGTTIIDRNKDINS